MANLTLSDLLKLQARAGRRWEVASPRQRAGVLRSMDFALARLNAEIARRTGTVPARP